MKLVIFSDCGEPMLLINGVDKPPYGIEVVNATGGVSLSGQLRMEISKILYENSNKPAKPVVPEVKKSIPVQEPEIPQVTPNDTDTKSGRILPFKKGK